MQLRVVQDQREGYQIVTVGLPRGLSCPTCQKRYTYLWFHAPTHTLVCSSCRWPDEP